MALCYKNIPSDVSFRITEKEMSLIVKLLRFSSNAENAEADEQVEMIFGVPEKNHFNLVLDAKH